jgi:hypothetical protein
MRFSIALNDLMKTVISRLKSKLRSLPEPLRELLRLVAYPRRQARYLWDWLVFKKDATWIINALRARKKEWRGEVLIHSTHGFIPSLKEELIYGAMLAWHGYRPVFLTTRNLTHERYLRLFDMFRIVYWEDFHPNPDENERRLAAELVGSVRRAEDLVALEHGSIAVGRHALSWFMRTTRTGTLNLDEHRPQLIEHVAHSLSAARAARALLDKESAGSVLMNERGYTPFGEFFDVALERGRRVVQHISAHQDNTRIFKAYTADRRTDHPSSLSDKSWQRALSDSFGEEEIDRLLVHWRDCYASRTWFNFQRLQHLTRLQTREEIFAQLNLDPAKKTAIVFAHIFWDATFFYGENLYFDYQTWFVETIRLANKNTQVNWVIKLHPVNVWRLEADGAVNERYSELVALDEAGIKLSPHVRLLLPDTHISTWSLFEAGDYGVTVRGTVGIEMAALGKRVITAGGGHYSARHFTTTPKSIEEYAGMILNIDKLPPAGAKERDRALRYAYWLLWKKSFRFGTFTIKYSSAKNVFHPLNGRPVFLVTNPALFFEAAAAKYWASWLTSSQEADCIFEEHSIPAPVNMKPLEARVAHSGNGAGL